MRPLLLRLHRWVALVFALPLLAVVGTGLVLAVEPGLKASVPAGRVTLDRLLAVLDAAGPGAEGAGLFLRAYEGTVAIGGRGGAKTFDLATAAPVAPGPWPEIFLTARRLHEHLLFDLGWLVTASSFALLALAAIGLLLGLPRLRHTLLGWHKVTGWVLLPLLVTSPLTGIFLAWRISFTPPQEAAAAGTAPLRQVLEQVAERHDLGGLDFIRPMRGGRVVRVLDAGGTAVTYRVTAAGLQAQPTNWPRVLHEGNWGGLAGTFANLVAGLAMLGLLGTGVVLWARRKLRQRAARRRALAAA